MSDDPTTPAPSKPTPTGRELTRAEKLYIEASKNSFNVFIRGMRVPAAIGPVIFDRIMQPFQRETFEALEPSLQALRVGDDPPCRRFWVERTKKASKDGDMAACVIWLIAFTEKPLLIQVVAAHKGQASILRERIDEILFHNPWLNDFIEPHQGGYRSKRYPKVVLLKVEATDSTGGAHGGLPDLLILNELVHVAKWKAMQDHYANVTGSPRGVLCIVTNAGIKGTQAHVWRNTALADCGPCGRWSTHILAEPSPWLNEEDIEEARRQDPIGSEFNRLFKGNWISGSGDALTEAEIDSIFNQPGPTLAPQTGWWYIGGLDLGISHDHAGLAIIGINVDEQLIRIANVRDFPPEIPNEHGQKEVDSGAVEDLLEKWNRAYNLQWIGYDPAAGGSFMAQRLRKKGIPMYGVSFASPKNMTEMAQALVSSVKDRKLQSYEDLGGVIRRDFGKFSIERKLPGGYKLVAVSDEFGHADVGTALVITLPRAVGFLEGRIGLTPEDDLAFDNGEDLTKEEVEDMPEELAEIYNEQELLDEEFDREFGRTVGPRGRRRKRVLGHGDWDDFE